jgi:hypothetical protein
MTVAEIMEQAKTLSAQERKELVKQLVDTLEIVSPIAADADEQEPWGKRLVRLLQQTDLADWGDPSIEDPVEAVEALRHQKPY